MRNEFRKMQKRELQEWLKINKPKTIPSGKVYKRKPKYKEW